MTSDLALGVGKNRDAIRVRKRGAGILLEKIRMVSEAALPDVVRRKVVVEKWRVPNRNTQLPRLSGAPSGTCPVIPPIVH
jgi:hypothetical protein